MVVGRIKNGITASLSLSDTHLNVESGLVCGSTVGGWEFLLCRDGAFIVKEGALMVKNDGI